MISRVGAPMVAQDQLERQGQGLQDADAKFSKLTDELGTLSLIHI